MSHRVLNVNIGILGHVDSGKTSLVKALSTSLSTAALDKHPQSQQRGITLDLGFSAFTLPLPDHLRTTPSSSDSSQQQPIHHSHEAKEDDTTTTAATTTTTTTTTITTTTTTTTAASAASAASQIVESSPPVDSHFDFLQCTLVDCPGHASLIRTIIGGAQIIDMIVLVIDINKGIQTQTAECIVIGEMTTDNLIVVLNKVDKIPEEERETKVTNMTKRIRSVFAQTKFHDVTIVVTAAAVGGGKVAATIQHTGKGSSGSSSSSSSSSTSESSSGSGSGSGSITKIDTVGINDLVDIIRNSIKVPKRDQLGYFYFAIDHCFSIKGHGTVLTGTVLKGAVSLNSEIEIPELKLTRRIKSMQMFRKPVKQAYQGDRVGLCVTSLDSKSIERGIACAPDSVPLLSTIICIVRKVRFFKGVCRSESKFHISIGHSTVVADVTFFGSKELIRMDAANKSRSVDDSSAMEEKEYDEESPSSTLLVSSKTTVHKSSSSSISMSKKHSSKNASHIDLNQPPPTLNASFQNKFPETHFDWDADFEQQSELIGCDIESGGYGKEPLQWACIRLQQPVYCPNESLIIGSRLDMGAGHIDPKASKSSQSSAKECRLAFYGPIREAIQYSSTSTSRMPKIYVWKLKESFVFRLEDVRNDLCYEIIAWKLYKKEGTVKPFIGMKLETENGDIGTIIGPFGSSLKFRVKFPNGVKGIKAGDMLSLRFKRFLNDPEKKMIQTGIGEPGKWHESPPRPFHSDSTPSPATSHCDDIVDGLASSLHLESSSSSTVTASPIPVVAIPVSTTNESSSNGYITTTQLDLDSDSSGTPAQPTKFISGPLSPAPPTLSISAADTSNKVMLETRIGTIEKLKDDGGDDFDIIAIVHGAFIMKENPKLFVGSMVSLQSDSLVVGQLLGPYAKMGKCKVGFRNDDKPKLAVGQEVVMNLVQFLSE
jgi:selenocysteine-specific elongation factor